METEKEIIKMKTVVTEIQMGKAENQMMETQASMVGTKEEKGILILQSAT